MPVSSSPSHPTVLPYHRWLLVNRLAGKQVRRRLGPALDQADAGLDDLLALVDDGFVEVVRAGGRLDAKQVHEVVDQNFPGDIRAYQVQATAASHRWYVASTYNRFLVALKGLGKPTLSQVCDMVGVRMYEVPADLVEQGLIEVFNGTGEQAQPRSLRVAPTPHWKVRLTSKGRHLVAN